MLDILVPMTNDRHIYTVNTDGTGLFQVTNHGAGRLGEGDEAPTGERTRWHTRPDQDRGLFDSARAGLRTGPLLVGRPTRASPLR